MQSKMKLKALNILANISFIVFNPAQLGITKSVVSFYELQARSPSPEVLAKLAQIFHVSADYLLGLDTRETIDVSGLAEKDISALLN